MVASPYFPGRRTLAAFTFFVFCLGGAWAEDFTPWMPHKELNTYLSGLDGEKPGGKNFWDRGNWIIAVEGRWGVDGPEYRINHAPVPPLRAYWWQWYIDMEQADFDRMIDRLAEQGYALMQFQSYQRPSGTERFQGIWQKTVPRTGAPPLPPGRYRLTEMDGQPYELPLISLVIADTKVSGRGPATIYFGSVRDRYTGRMTRKAEPMPGAPPPASAKELEARYFQFLEFSKWTEENGELRALQNEKVVLRFQRDEVKLEDDEPAK